ncbi:glutaredoxin 3 [Prochlorothrix hollandica]|uniref:glutaredoxin 3 n=1 Tax=Prochlorothrix hollandica TaxID=1223 RepID=UPI0003648A30|nr:glutaredoxin 3 [Prochlorothrix hollandica]
MTLPLIDWLNQWLGRDPSRLQAQVEIYSWQTCPYCIRAKLLLMWKGVEFVDYKIDGDGAARSQMADRSGGRRTVPQIFINQVHVGGCDDLYGLDAQGQLDGLLAAAPPSP